MRFDGLTGYRYNDFFPCGRGMRFDGLNGDRYNDFFPCGSGDAGFSESICRGQASAYRTRILGERGMNKKKEQNDDFVLFLLGICGVKGL